MPDETSKIEDVEIKNLTREQVDGMAKQVGTFIAGALFHLGVASNVAENLRIIIQNGDHELERSFKEHVFYTLSQALDTGIAGLVKRNELAKTMREMNTEMLYESCTIAVNNKDSESPEEAIKMVEGLLDTAEYCQKCADALYKGIRRNLNNLVSQGRHVAVMKEMLVKNREAAEDEAHDSECDDPNCPIHTNH